MQRLRENLNYLVRKTSDHGPDFEKMEVKLLSACFCSQKAERGKQIWVETPPYKVLAA